MITTFVVVQYYNKKTIKNDNVSYIITLNKLRS